MDNYLMYGSTLIHRASVRTSVTQEKIKETIIASKINNNDGN